MINSKDFDPKFKYEVIKESGGENITRCLSCGTCSNICPIFEANNEYNPRKIIRMVLLGMKEEVLKNDLIWKCSGCYSCYELCPKDVKITNVMSALRNIASREGFVPDSIIGSVELLEKFGRLLEVSEFENTTRNKKGIPEMDLNIPEIKDLLDISGIFDVVKEHDMKTEHYGPQLLKKKDDGK